MERPIYIQVNRHDMGNISCGAFMVAADKNFALL